MAKVDVQEASEDTSVSTAPVETQAPVEATPAPVAAQPAAVVQPGKKINLKSVKLSKRSAIDVLLVLVIVGLGAWSFMLYSDNKDLKTELTKVQADPQIAVEQQTKDLLGKVGALITLPKDETPTIAQVSDAAKAKKQSAFFANAENGDKVLMYVKSGQAILYRPSTNKIIIVAPLTFSKDANTKTTTDSSTD